MADRQMEVLERENETLAAALECATTLDLQDDLASALHQTLTQLRNYLKASEAWLLWREHASGLFIAARVDESKKKSATYDLKVLAAGEEVTRHDHGITLPFAPGECVPSTLAIRQLQTELGCGQIVAYPIRSLGEETVGQVASGAFIASFESPQNKPAILSVVLPVIGSKIKQRKRMEPTGFESLARKLATHRLLSCRKWGLPIVVCLVLLCCLPANYTIKARCDLQPLQRRYVAAPIDGPLKQSSVRPGDHVSQNQVIAEIDSQQIDYEMASLVAQLDQAKQDHKQAVIEHNSINVQIAVLEKKRLQGQVDLLAHQKNALIVRSPIDGMIVGGDWKGANQKPLTRGDTLFEIASLDRMNARIRIDEQDYQHVERDMPVIVRFDAVPNREWVAKIQRVLPEAEVIENENVFIAEVEIQDNAQSLRPGMMGRATVYSHLHSIGWNLMHKPFASLRNWIGW